MHKPFLLAALNQAFLGRGQCAPNPAVGAVAVVDEKIIAQAYHSGAGTPHAEQKLLDLLPTDCSNIWLYVTLEPCNHWGKTPPCVDAIVARGIRKVIFAFYDPNPIVRENSTTQYLQSHGIEVTHFPLPEIDQFYQSYVHWVKTGLPFVTVKMAHSLDGKIAGEGGARIQLSNPLCSEFTHQHRQQCDIILTTSRTVNQDNPQFNVRLGQVITSKPVTVLDRTGQLNPAAQIFQTASHLLIFTNELRTADSDNIRYKVTPEHNGLLDLSFVLKTLGKMGYHDVWVEAGARLFTAFHQAALVQRTFLYIVPQLLGSKAIDLFLQPMAFFNQPHTIYWIEKADNMILQINWESVCLQD